ncbi:MAG: cysteine desulfurase [Acidobacteria bacterium]|nr:cysteine desulfurase [Acidobacteriota bacterium]
MPIRMPIYLDYNATTPVDPRVLEVMIPAFSRDFGNAASRSHRYGWKAEAIVKDAREALAEALGARPEEILFTSGATESNNLALLGVARANRSRGAHIVTSATEHRSVLDPCRQLSSEGFQVTVLPPDGFGITSASAVAAAITPETILVSVMAANNETGTLNPVREIAELCRERGVLFHTDAVQALGKVPVRVDEMPADLVSLSAHKLYGPKGIGALYLRTKSPRLKIEPLLLGGGHERGIRSGTLNVPAIAGFGSATRIAHRQMEGEAARTRDLRDLLHRRISEGLSGVRLNGHRERRLPGTLNLTFDGVDGETLLMDLRDLAVSSGSACSSAASEPSHVLRAMGLSASEAKASIRFSVGRFTTRAEIEFASSQVVRTVAELREGVFGRSTPAAEPATPRG